LLEDEVERRAQKQLTSIRLSTASRSCTWPAATTSGASVMC
jgi:hypothetical protein